jgi:glycosyltransferase 2 family protein
MLKRILLISIKFALAGGLFYWLYQQQWLDFSPLWALEVNGRTLMYLSAALGLFLSGLLIISWRLWLLMRSRRFKAPFRDVMNITFVSSLAGTLLPGIVGMDALKVLFFCSRVAERRMDAFVAVVFDRLVGLYGLFVLASLTSGAAWFIGVTQVPLYVFWIAPAVWFGLTLATALLMWERMYQARLIQLLLSRLPSLLVHFIEALRHILTQQRLLLGLIALSVLNHIFSVGAFIFAALLLADTLPLLLHFALTPLAMFMNAVPLTPGGLGLTESAFAFLFQAAGSDKGALIGLLGRLLMYSVFVVSGLIGLLFLRWHGYPIEALKSESVSTNMPN